MTVEEYERRSNEIMEQINNLNAERNRLNNQMIEESEFCTGDDVIITLNNGEIIKAYIWQMRAGKVAGMYYHNGISYIFKPYTKSGKRGKVDLFCNIKANISSFELIRPVFNGTNEDECEAFDNRY